MVPLVTCIEELREAKALVEEVKKELDGRNIAYNKDIQVGIMVETAAASLIADTSGVVTTNALSAPAIAFLNPCSIPAGQSKRI